MSRNIFFLLFIIFSALILTTMALFVVRALANVGGVYFAPSGPGLAAAALISVIGAGWSARLMER